MSRGASSRACASIDHVREGRELIEATSEFARESRATSWRHTIVSLLLLAAAIALAASAGWWPVRLAASLGAGLLAVRAFVLYHDFMHGSILRGSTVAKAIFHAYGVLALTPPRVWRETHNYHHAHTAKIVGSHVGSFPVLTVEMWRALGRKERLAYRIVRHPMTIALGYFGVFLYGMCISPFLRKPRRNWDSALALVLHVALVIAVAVIADPLTALFTLVVPLFVACALGGYLFYAQHNFEGTHIQSQQGWSYTRAALESSSYMELGPVMSWVTGNIGYHHVHHLNPSIPFYRLPEAMAHVPELQRARQTTLAPGEIARCCRLKLWDAAASRMVGWDHLMDGGRGRGRASEPDPPAKRS